MAGQSSQAYLSIHESYFSLGPKKLHRKVEPFMQMNRTQTGLTIDIKKSITVARGSIRENPWMTDNMRI